MIFLRNSLAIWARKPGVKLEAVFKEDMGRGKIGMMKERGCSRTSMMGGQGTDY
jgi:hypothetical protein